jgi:5,10-methylenetetrahydrofolate reductase
VHGVSFINTVERRKSLVSIKSQLDLKKRLVKLKDDMKENSTAEKQREVDEALKIKKQQEHQMFIMQRNKVLILNNVNRCLK